MASEFKIKEGFLVKRGHVVKSWKKRFFMLSKSTLAYASNVGDKKPKGTINLTGASITVGAPAGVEKSVKGHVFTVTENGALVSEEWGLPGSDKASGRKSPPVGSAKAAPPPAAVSYIFAAETEAERALWVEAIQCNIRVAQASRRDAAAAEASDVAATAAIALVDAATPTAGSDAGGSSRPSSASFLPMAISAAASASVDAAKRGSFAEPSDGGGGAAPIPRSRTPSVADGATQGLQSGVSIDNRHARVTSMAATPTLTAAAPPVVPSLLSVASSDSVTAAPPLLPLDDPNYGQSGPLPQNLRIFSGTWNMAEEPPPPSFSEDWLPKHCDVYALSLQECMHADAVLSAVLKHIGPGYLEIHHRIGATMKGLGFHGHIVIAVFVRDWMVSRGVCKLSKAVRASVALGRNLYLTRAANKGAVAISLPIRLPDGQGNLSISSALVFVSCHLTSDSKGKNKIEKRNRDARVMLESLGLALSPIAIQRARSQAIGRSKGLTGTSGDVQSSTTAAPSASTTAAAAVVPGAAASAVHSSAPAAPIAAVNSRAARIAALASRPRGDSISNVNSLLVPPSPSLGAAAQVAASPALGAVSVLPFMQASSAAVEDWSAGAASSTVAPLTDLSLLGINRAPAAPAAASAAFNIVDENGGGGGGNGNNLNTSMASAILDADSDSDAAADLLGIEDDDDDEFDTGSFAEGDAVPAPAAMYSATDGVSQPGAASALSRPTAFSDDESSTSDGETTSLFKESSAKVTDDGMLPQPAESANVSGADASIGTGFDGRTPNPTASSASSTASASNPASGAVSGSENEQGLSGASKKQRSGSVSSKDGPRKYSFWPTGLGFGGPSAGSSSASTDGRTVSSSKRGGVGDADEDDDMDGEGIDVVFVSPNGEERRLSRKASRRGNGASSNASSPASPRAKSASTGAGNAASSSSLLSNMDYPLGIAPGRAYVVLSGDLNYRIDMSCEEALIAIADAGAAEAKAGLASPTVSSSGTAPAALPAAVAELQKPWSRLLAADQMRKEMQGAAVLPGFAEPPIAFPPSYRRRKSAGPPVLVRSRGDHADIGKVRDAYATVVKKTASGAEAVGSVATPISSPISKPRSMSEGVAATGVNINGDPSMVSVAAADLEAMGEGAEAGSAAAAAEKELLMPAGAPSERSTTGSGVVINGGSDAIGKAEQAIKKSQLRIPSYTDRCLARNPLLSGVVITAADFANQRNRRRSRRYSRKITPQTTAVEESTTSAAATARTDGIAAVHDSHASADDMPAFVPLPPLKAVSYDGCDTVACSDHMPVAAIWELSLLPTVSARPLSAPPSVPVASGKLRPFATPVPIPSPLEIIPTRRGVSTANLLASSASATAATAPADGKSAAASGQAAKAGGGKAAVVDDDDDIDDDDADAADAEATQGSAAAADALSNLSSINLLLGSDAGPVYRVAHLHPSKDALFDVDRMARNIAARMKSPALLESCMARAIADGRIPISRLQWEALVAAVATTSHAGVAELGSAGGVVASSAGDRADDEDELALFPELGLMPPPSYLRAPSAKVSDKKSRIAADMSLAASDPLQLPTEPMPSLASVPLHILPPVVRIAIQQRLDASGTAASKTVAAAPGSDVDVAGLTPVPAVTAAVPATEAPVAPHSASLEAPVEASSAATQPAASDVAEIQHEAMHAPEPAPAVAPVSDALDTSFADVLERIQGGDGNAGDGGADSPAHVVLTAISSNTTSATVPVSESSTVASADASGIAGPADAVAAASKLVVPPPNKPVKLASGTFAASATSGASTSSTGGVVQAAAIGVVPPPKASSLPSQHRSANANGRGVGRGGVVNLDSGNAYDDDDGLDGGAVSSKVSSMRNMWQNRAGGGGQR